MTDTFVLEYILHFIVDHTLNMCICRGFSCPLISILSHSAFNFNPLPDIAILGSSNSVANKDLMSKTWPNGRIVRLYGSLIHCKLTES